MSFFAILFALLIEQARPLARSNPIHAGLRAWALSVSRNFDAGKPHHGWVAWGLTVVLPALVALGMRPVWDDSGRPGRVQTIAVYALKRPRFDVLMSITGSYRDQFPSLMALLDRAVAQAAAAEPGNAIARNTGQISRELRQGGVPQAQAEQLARVRSFGNAVCAYSTRPATSLQRHGLQTNDPPPGQMVH